MSISTSNVKETSGSKYIAPGVENDVVIENIMGVEAVEGRSPYIEFTFRKPQATAEDGTKIRIYMSEKSKEMSIKKILHIATKVVKRAQIDAVVGNTFEEYGAMLNRLLRGKHLRMKFLAEEYYSKSKDKVNTKPSLGLPDFAEAIMEGAEYPAVSNSATKLTFNPDKDTIRLKSAPSSNSVMLEDTTVNDDLPF